MDGNAIEYYFIAPGFQLSLYTIRYGMAVHYPDRLASCIGAPFRWRFPILLPGDLGMFYITGLTQYQERAGL